jgi:hypothetical protein
MAVTIDDVSPDRGVARMARFGVRSGSLAFARPIGNPENKRLERTDANRSERSLALLPLSTTRAAGGSC